MAKNFIYEQEFTCRFFEEDADGYISLPFLLRYSQEISMIHANLLEFSGGKFSDLGLTWVLARTYMQIDYYPKSSEGLVVKTWPSSLRKSLTSRDCVLFTHSGKKVGTVTNSWIVFDINTRKMAAVPEWISSQVEEFPERALDFETTTVAKLSQVDFSENVRAKSFYCDANRHINNTYLFQWMLEGLTEPYTFRPSSIDIIFRAECLADTNCISQRQNGDKNTLHNIVTGQGQEVARAIFKWK